MIMTTKEISIALDPVIEREARKSEQSIRARQVNNLLAKPHEWKVHQSSEKIQEFESILGEENIYVSTSGGKDSAVVSALAKAEFPHIKHIMFDTGLEYRATLNLAKQQGAEIVKPCRGWKDFCENFGYPIVSKQVSKRLHDSLVSPIGAALTMYSRCYHLSHKWLHLFELVDFPVSQKCCDEYKKKPAKKLKLNPIIGTRVTESAVRKNAWKKSGCNSYSMDYKHGISRPISLWTDEDVDRYVKDHDVPLSDLYTQYEAKRTGCIICPYGAHLENNSRFELLKKLEPKRYQYFMDHTRLPDILALSGVKIPSDDKYMQHFANVSEKVKLWHNGRDYKEFKKQWCLQHYSKVEMLAAIEHIGDNNLLYPIKELRLEYAEEQQQPTKGETK